MGDQTLKESIRADLNTARRDRDKLRTTVLTTVLSDVRNREIELGGDIDDAEVQRLLTTAIKRRREAAEQMQAGGRPELADKEEREAEMLQAYLPPELDEAEVRKIVRDAVNGGADDIGAVMKAVMPRVSGRFDGKEVNRIAREELG